MEDFHDYEDTCARYLLGELSEPELAHFEESYFADDSLFERFRAVKDDLIDAYARAVALAQKDPKQATAMVQWRARLSDFYKFRHDNSDAGLNELISGVLATPLPQS